MYLPPPFDCIAANLCLFFARVFPVYDSSFTDRKISDVICLVFSFNALYLGTKTLADSKFNVRQQCICL